MGKSTPKPLTLALSVIFALTMLTSCGTNRSIDANDIVVISIVGTNDVHGELLPKPGRGGLVTISGYVDALRAARGPDRVLLIDAGDMWQGTLESNLTEGAAVVDIYNAMGYVAAAVGNHEFDFGPAGGAATPQDDDDDARGALKLRASEADFPLLSANLADEYDGRPVSWNNVQPSIIVDVGGILVGVVGVMTEEALATTIAANTRGLDVLPLATSVRREAKDLREKGAKLVIVAAHAGGRCSDFSDPLDLSSCDTGSEVVRLAEALPVGLVDHIIAGHVHQGMAHVVNDISITSSYSHTHSFSRVDLSMDKATGRRVSREVFPPQLACPRWDTEDSCVWQLAAQDSARPAVYEGQVVEPNADVLEIAQRAARRALDRKLEDLGAFLETPFTLKGNPESALGNLMTDAMLDSVAGDIAIHNVSGGIRAILPAGELTFGAVYEMFPFDNRVVVLELTGRQLRKVIAAQALKSRRRAGISGMHVTASCAGGTLAIEMRLADERVVSDTDRVNVIVNDFLALGGDDILTPVLPAGGFEFDDSLPLVRDVLVEWFRDRGSLRADAFLTGDAPKWRVPADAVDACDPPGLPAGH